MSGPFRTDGLSTVPVRPPAYTEIRAELARLGRELEEIQARREALERLSAELQQINSRLASLEEGVACLYRDDGS